MAEAEPVAGMTRGPAGAWDGRRRAGSADVAGTADVAGPGGGVAERRSGRRRGRGALRAGDAFRAARIRMNRVHGVNRVRGVVRVREGWAGHRVGDGDDRGDRLDDRHRGLVAGAVAVR